MPIQFPNYSRSLLSLAASILTYYGAATPHQTLPEMDALLKTGPRNVVIMLFDAMGPSILAKHLPEDSFLRRHCTGVLSSVFPPTTTAATVTMQSGLSPIEHGWLGWNLFFEEIGSNVSIFPNTLPGTGGKPAAPYRVAERYLPYRTIYEKIAEATAGEVRAQSVSPFSTPAAKTVEDICQGVRALCAEEGRHYIYTYWDQPDSAMHEKGTGHPEAEAVLRRINAETEALCSALSDALVVIISDHGMVDTTWRFLPDYPDIAACLGRAPSLEQRALSVFVRPGMHGQFEAAFREGLGDNYLLLSRAQVMEGFAPGQPPSADGPAVPLFGPGKPHPRAYGFLGDYLAVATGPVSFEYASAMDHPPFKAAHAGLTQEEMESPFIVVRR